jgi:hypothetical protein
MKVSSNMRSQYSEGFSVIAFNTALGLVNYCVVERLLEIA